MTPDLKRLCEAASNVELDMYPDYLRTEEAEKVVRAVLTELKRSSFPELPTDERVWITPDWRSGSESVTGEDELNVFRTRIDYILGEPATA
jgi:hypothetical protein